MKFFSPARKRESGFVLVWGALSFTALLAAAAFCVDLGNWYLNGQRQQRAADGAALAGASFLPGQESAGYNASVVNLKTNRFKESDTSYIGPDSQKPDHMRVTVRRKVPTVFLGAFGIRNWTISRTALAAKEAGVPLGSPLNVLGVEPEGPSWAAYSGHAQGFWLSTNGSGRVKESQDRYNAKYCAGMEDYCTNGRNDEYTPDGHDFAVEVRNGQLGRLQVQVYDPQFCTSGSCPPDEELVSGTPTSRYTIYDSSGSHAAIPSCTRAFPAGPKTGWTTICDINIDGATYKPGVFKLNVKTTSSGDVNGENNYVLRAAFISGGSPDLVASRNINVYAMSKMTTNYESSNVLEYYIAKVPSSFAGRKVTVEFFDLAEDSGGGSLRIVWADPAKPALTGCTATTPATGGSVNMNNNCVSNMSGYNREGRVVRYEIPIPASYQCIETNVDSCWIKAIVNVGGSAVEGSTLTAGTPGKLLRLWE